MSGDKDISEQLRAIEESLRETLAMSRLLLAVRLVQDGHAKDLREASRIAKDIDRVAALYPVEEDEE